MKEFQVGKFSVTAFDRIQDGRRCYIERALGSHKQEFQTKIEDLRDLQYVVEKAIRIMERE